MASRVLARPSDVAIAARAGDENFPVASRALPGHLRRHLLAIYGFCRLADELGDNYGGDRLAALDWLETELDRAYAGSARHPTLRRLSATLATVELPRRLFADLIEANRIDQRVHHYGTFDELVGYCRYSANPVGRLVLDLFGATTPARVAWSDRVCTGLQLAEHWQDVGEDAAAGRVYLPEEDLHRFGVAVEDLGAPSATPALRALLRFEVARTRWWLADGRRLVADLTGPARLATAGFVAGGSAALDAILAADCDVLGHRARPRPGRLVRHAAALLLARVRSAGSAP
ncbi:MAG TPA: squalene synthase HpnC [Acidimicrobiales bacterium]